MFQNIGFTEILLIAIVALVLFGPQKLPEIGRVLGRTIRDFKKGAHALLNDEPQAPAEPTAAPVTPAAQAPAQSSPASTGPAETGASTRPAVEFVSATPEVVESAAVPNAAVPNGAEPGSSVTPREVESANAELGTVRAVAEPEQTKAAPSPGDAPLVTPAAPVATAPPTAAPIAPPSNTRRLPD